jgi:acetyl-CoA carboxylase carboxyl transferase subunit beta
MVVHRHDLRPTLARLCRLLMRLPANGAAPATDMAADDKPEHEEPIRPASSDAEISPL